MVSSSPFNLSLIEALVRKGDTLFIDEDYHASGILATKLLKKEQVIIFSHNDYQDLENKIKNRSSNGRFIIAIEAIYSMGGDIAPKEIFDIATKYDALLIVDEAHSTGIVGQFGSGLVNQLGLRKEVFATLHTFGKAVGSHGAIWAGSKELKQYLINFSRSFIYSTALHPSFIESVFWRLKNCYEAHDAREKLQGVLQIFDQEVKEMELGNLFPLTKTPIKICRLDNLQTALRIQKSLFEKKIFAKAVFSPTVPEGTERLRICLHANQTHQEIKSLLTEIKKEVNS